ncbi:MAG TPA: hypothetical protein VHU81_04855, partial [Thermoanaerobaculia bacterium]|nr:hypothetical protein [Thermoanaerobaculia bacterium]
MDIQSFTTALGRYIRNGLLELPLQNDLPSPGLAALIGDLWQGRPLKMLLRSQEVQGQSLLIRGTLPDGSCPFAPAGDLAFSGSFYLLDGGPELTLSAALPDGYRLPDSFRALVATPIQRAVFRDASLTLDSAANRTGEDRRLIFRGALRIKNEPLFRPVGWMLGEPDSIALEGAIRFGFDPDGASVPLLSFTGSARQPFELGPFKLSAAIGITAKVFETASSFRWYAGAVEILIYFGAGDFRLPLSMPLDLDGSPLKVLSLRGDSPRLSSFSQLSSVVDGPDYGGLLPAQIPLGSRLQLTRLDLTLAPALRQLSSVEIGVALDAEVEIIPDVLTLERTEIRFRFPNPRDLSRASVRLGAVLDIAGVGLEASMTLPGPILEAQLAPDESIPVSSLLRRFFGEGALPDGANFDVVELLVTAEPRAQTYGFEGIILGELPLDLGLFTLTLESLILEADFGPQGAAGRLACGFQLLGTRFEAAAEKPTPGEAWVFSAGLVPGSTISLSSAAETLLGLPSDALPELALEGVAFRIDSGSKAYALTARTAGFWEFQVTDDYLLRLAVDVRIERDAARKLSGELTGELFVNDFRVLTTYSFDPGVRRLQLEIQYQDLRLAASISSEQKPLGGGRRTVLRVDLGTLDLGAALRYLADVAAPGLDITLDEPWDLLMNLQLTNTVLVIDLTDKSVGFETRVDKNFGFVSVDTAGLLYYKKAGKPAVDLRITGRFLGTSYPADKPLSWNVLDGKAPDVPGRGSG